MIDKILDTLEPSLLIRLAVCAPVAFGTVYGLMIAIASILAAG